MLIITQAAEIILISKINVHVHLSKIDNGLPSKFIFKFVHVCDVDCLPVLNTLNLSHNRLSDVESLEHLAKLHTVSVLDLAHNKIEDPKVIEVFEQMQNLVSLHP